MPDTGLVLCTSGTDAGGGGQAWTNPGNITSSDATYATSVLSLSQSTNTLKGSVFGLSIPGNADILGILVRWRAKTSGIADGFVSVNVGKSDGTLGTPDISAPLLTGSDANYDFGGATSLWGLAWEPSDINAATFQVRSSDIDAGIGGTISVDAAWVQVFYSTDIILPIRNISEVRFR